MTEEVMSLERDSTLASDSTEASQLRPSEGVDNPDLLLSAYDYELPEHLIAQSPPLVRGGSRLLHVNRAQNQLVHRQFEDILACLRPNDLLVLNDTRVIPARLKGRRQSGGAVELLLLRRLETVQGTRFPHAAIWEAIGKPSSRFKPETPLILDDTFLAFPLERQGEGWRIRLESQQPVDEAIERFGELPLPHYIHRAGEADALVDRERYQTVYARVSGSAAAPTAGLHFTPTLLASLRSLGVDIRFVTLHVGPGTFSPVRTDQISEHKMHAEYWQMPADTWRSLVAARESGRRVVAVGTTSVRTLESAARELMARAGAPALRSLPASEWARLPAPQGGATSIFIYPGFEFQLVDAIITNFHLPRSSLIMLVSAFAGRERILRTYAEAVAREYRFFSYGDAMFIE